MHTVKARSLWFSAADNIIRSVSVDGSLSNHRGQTRNLKSFKEIPGPRTLPIIGPMHNFLPGGILAGYQGYKLEERLYKLYGPIVRIGGTLGARDTLFLFDPEAVGNVLRSEEPLPIRPGLPSLEYYRKRHKKTYDPNEITGLGTDQGENWRKLRTIVNPIMMQPKSMKQYSDVLNEVSDEMVARIRSMRDGDNKITKKFNVAMDLWALESLGVIALGTRLNCFDPNLPENSPVKELLRSAATAFDIIVKLDFKPNLWKLYSTPTFKKLMNILENHQRLVQYFINEAVKKLKVSKNTSDLKSEKSLLEKFLAIDVKIAYIMAEELLMGGADTVGIFHRLASVTMTSTLYLLATNPVKQNKLREEVLSKETQKPYLRACIKESMRMLAVLSVGNGRLTTKEYNLLGYKIPKDILVLFGHQYMSTMEEHFPKPHEFIPERWLVDKDDPLYHGNTNPFVFAPFGFGVRMCVGRRIAEIMLDSLITKIIQNLQIEWTTGQPINIVPTLSNHVKEPFHFIFKDVKNLSE